MGIKDNEKLAKRVRSASFLVAVGMVVGSLAGFLFTPPHQNDGGMTSQNLYHDHSLSSWHPTTSYGSSGSSSHAHDDDDNTNAMHDARDIKAAPTPKGISIIE